MNAPLPSLPRPFMARIDAKHVSRGIYAVSLILPNTVRRGRRGRP